MSETYVNRSGKPFSELLVKLAKLSPRAYAGIIRERNQELLRRLEEAEPAIGRGVWDPADSQLWYLCERAVPIGCPHCAPTIGGYSCAPCLWVKAKSLARAAGLPKDSILCALVPFPSGYNLMTQGRGDVVHVEYCARAAQIHRNRDARPASPVLTRDLYDSMRLFLEDHVDWAGLSCWGAECPEHLQETTKRKAGE